MFGLGKKKVEFHPVFAGRVVPVTEVPDPVFAQGMLGDGYAVIPDENADELVVCAPVDGEVAKLLRPCMRLRCMLSQVLICLCISA